MKKLLGILGLLILQLYYFGCTPPKPPANPQQDAQPMNPLQGDTTQTNIVLLYFEATAETLMVRCAEDDTINIPCGSEGDSILTFSCQNGLFITCGDTSHTPFIVPEVVYISCIDTSHKDVMTIHFEETDQTIKVCCEPGDTINIPCVYEDDGILTFTCEDGDSVSCGPATDEVK